MAPDPDNSKDDTKNTKKAKEDSKNDNASDATKETDKCVLIIKKCGKCKNPCRICTQTVTKRNGLQCQGACKKWVHFNCLGYSAGRVLDIKSGALTVVCPCPDCSTSFPKEFMLKPPLSLPQSDCLGNNYPACVAKEYPKQPCAPFQSMVPCQCIKPCSSNQDNVKVIPPGRKTSPKPAPGNQMLSKVPQISKPTPNNKLPNLLTEARMKSPQKLPKSCQQSGMTSQSCSCLISGLALDCKCSPMNKPNCQWAFDPCASNCSSTCSNPKVNHRNSDSMIDTLNQLCKTVVNLSEQIKIMVKKADAKRN